MSGYDPNASSDDRFRALFGREKTEGERKFFEARESGYTGWWDHDEARPVSDAEHQAGIDRWVQSQEAKGLEYTSDRGWVHRDEAAR